MTQNLKTVAPFTMNTVTGIIAGPRGYIASDAYKRKLAEIAAGRDTISGSDFAETDPVLSVLKSIRGDWVAWRTRRDF